ncbi:uncharacterized protein METZ01_LOCUS81838, partial [marine metagenome]
VVQRAVKVQNSAGGSTLSLLVTWVGTDYTDNAVATDDLAVPAHLLD